MSKKETTTLYVQGMHCAACEMLLQRELEGLAGVTDVKASLASQTVTVTHTKQAGKTLIDEANAHVSDDGYILLSKPIGSVAWNQDTIIRVVSVLAIAHIAYLLIESSGLLGYATISSDSPLIGYIVFGLLAGVSSCAALTGGLLMSLSKDWSSRYGSKSKIQATIPFVLFNSGRLISFALFGAVLGLLGSAFHISLSATSILVAGVSVLMVLIGTQMLGVAWAQHIRIQLPQSLTQRMSSSRSFHGKYMPFLAGAGTFFLPCGFTLLVQSVAVALGNPLQSGIVLFLFALGTLPSLVAISVTSISFQTKPQTATTYNLVIGTLIVLFGLYNLNIQLGLLGLPNTRLLTNLTQLTDANGARTNDAAGVKETIENGQPIQSVTMRAEGFEYFPKSFTLKAGVPTTVTVEPNQVVGCAQAMYLPGLYDDVVLLNDGPKTISFTPQKGTYSISCSMGMVSPVTVTVL